MDNDIIYSSNNTHALHHHFFDPKDSESKATLLILHGMSEHSGRYTTLAEFLSQQGIAVATYDHIGHGKTAQSTTELGFFDSAHPFQTLLKDTIIMADALKARHPHVPHFIMGHSMGSFIVRNVLKHHAQSFAGAILMGTSDKDPSVHLFLPLFNLLNKLAPKTKSNLGAVISSKILKGKLKNNTNPSPHAWLSESTDNIQAFEADELCGFAFTNNGYYTLARLMQGALNQPWYDNIKPDFPMMLISGQEDPVGNMGKGIDNLANRLHSQGYSRINKTMYPNMRHEPLHEAQHQVVFQDIADWLNEQLSS